MTATGATVFVPGEIGLSDLAHMAEADEHHRYELIDGVVRIVAPPSVRHQQIVSRIMSWLMRFAAAPDLVLTAAGLAVEGRTGGVQPDVMLLRRLTDTTGSPYLDPTEVELVVEVLSPSNRNADLVEKRRVYAEAGIRHYWIVDPADPVGESTVTRLRLGTRGLYAAPDGSHGVRPEAVVELPERRPVRLDDVLRGSPEVYGVVVSGP
jgi:Uma2 family endonuclease